MSLKKKREAEYLEGA